MSLNLYYYFLCPFSRSVKYFLKSNQISFVDFHMDLAFGEHTSREYRKINPLQKVPAIKENDFILFESSSILRYLCNSREIESAQYPNDPQKRGKIDLYFDWQAANLLDMLKYAEVAKGFSLNSNIEEVKRKTDEILDEFEKIFLLEAKFIGGNDTITIADIAIVWHLAGLIDFGYEPSKRIKQYLVDLYQSDPNLEEEVDYYLSERRSALKQNILLPFTSFKNKK